VITCRFFARGAPGMRGRPTPHAQRLKYSMLRPLVSVVVSLLLAAAPRLRAQHAGHDMGAMGHDSTRSSAHVMAQAIPLFTRADPTAGGAPANQFLLTQLLLMGRASFWRGHGALDAALNGEGLTMPDGELNTGAHGEGFVDRRHPHTYVHELMLSVQGRLAPVSYSLSAGRGFAAFGTDDPMMRPLVKYPINHHLSQILERLTLTGAVRAGALIVEGSTFGGDEPEEPSSLPVARRFGDSWSARATLLPRAGIELQGSYARVASPEQPTGFGLDQRKQSYSVRTISEDGSRYALAEWSRTVERDHDRDAGVFGYESALVEGSVHAGAAKVALRLEQTERPEEERLDEPFRTPRPAGDLGIHGITRWRVATLQVAAPAVTAGWLSGFPFVEGAVLDAAPRNASALFTPERVYGTSRFWMLTAGVRLRAGTAHARMGRYGVALPGGPAIGSLAR
jgi:hypothetical protein